MGLPESARRNGGRRPVFGTSPLGPMRAGTSTMLDGGHPMRTAISPTRVPVILSLFLLLLLVPSLMAVTVSPLRSGSITVPPARLRSFVVPGTGTRVVPPRTAPRVVRIRMSPRRPCGLLSGGGSPFIIPGRLPSALVMRRSPRILARNL